MSDTIMRKSYTVVCVRTTGQPMELQTVSDYAAAVNSAKEALTNSKNTEVRVVENKYDSATRKDKKQIVKILTPESNGSGRSGGSSSRRSTKGSQGVSREVANQATKGIVYIVIAVTVLILLGGILVPIAMR
ncbi:hypothetical protein [Thalassospira lucentensis]|uniref:hypothetical protein n=1 Tax=Thalassospira lucentensis TaxID=168935 RepID=UPI003AA9BCC7